MQTLEPLGLTLWPCGLVDCNVCRCSGISHSASSSWLGVGFPDRAPGGGGLGGVADIGLILQILLSFRPPGPLIIEPYYNYGIILLLIVKAPIVVLFLRVSWSSSSRFSRSPHARNEGAARGSWSEDPASLCCFRDPGCISFGV